MRMTKQILIRIIADALLVNLAALATSTLLQSLFPSIAAFRSFSHHRQCALVLMIVCPITFYLSGLYTYGRAFRVRYKAVTILRATTTAYLVTVVVAFATGLTPEEALPFLGFSWLGSMGLLAGARAAPLIWSSGVVSRQLAAVLGEQSQPEQTPHVLVIGGAGYIGSALVERLLEQDYRVRVLDLLLYGDEPIARFFGHPNFELLQGDFRHIDTGVCATKDVDIIVHLGAIVGDSACSIDQDTTIEINLRATRTIAQVGKGFGVKRFIFASTCSVYGASDQILDERSALNPISLYARTKIESEKTLLSLADGAFSPTILRFGTVYGLSGRPRFDLVVNLLAAKAVQEGKVGIFGGSQWRPFVHVKDVAEAILLAMQAPLSNVHAQVFNVGSNEQNFQIAELGTIIQKMIPAASVVTQEQEDNRNYRVRFDKIHQMLGFRPRYALRDGVKEIIDAIATGKIADYHHPCYSNFSFLKQNGHLRPLLIEDVGAWDWLKLSATDALLLTEVVLAVTESHLPEMSARLRKALVQAILGDVDGFIHILTGLDLVRPRPVHLHAETWSAPEPQVTSSG